MKIKQGDNVIVIAGKDKGATGKVTRVLRAEEKVVIEGVNMVQRHMKRGVGAPHGQIVEKAMPLHVSNVALVDPKTKKATRVGYKVEGGTKVRIARGSGAEIK